MKEENLGAMIFQHGGGIISVPASDDMGRSYHPTIFVMDEAAVHEHDRAVFASVMGAVGTEGRVVIFSTPRGFGNRFEEYYHDAEAGRNGFFHRKLHWWELGENDPAWRAGHDQQWYIEQCAGFNNDPAVIAEELDCDFVQSGSPVFIKTDLDVIFGVKQGRIANRGRPVVQDERVIVAIDPATGEAKGGSDNTSIDVLDGRGNQIHHEQWQKPSGEAQKRIYDLLAQYTRPTVIVARTAMGILYCTWLRNGPWRLVEVNETIGAVERPPGEMDLNAPMSTATVRHWYEVGVAALVLPLQSDVQQHAFRAYHETTRDEMLVYSRIGPDRYSAPSGRHDDTVRSLALARWGYRKGWSKSKEEVKMETGNVEMPSTHFDLGSGE
jgi:hypothetical protein